MALKQLTKPIIFRPSPVVRKDTADVVPTVEAEVVELPSVEPTSDPVEAAVQVTEQRKDADTFQPFLLSNAQIERYLEANPEVKGMFCDSKTTWSYGQRVTKYGPINWTLVNKWIFWIDSSKVVHMDPRNWDEALPPAMPGGVR